MESVLSTKITSAVDSFSHLKQVIISSPTTVRQFPHIKSIPCLKLLSIPSDCDDWQWLVHVKCLSELHATVRGTHGDSGSILIPTNNAQANADKAELKSMADTETVAALANILSHLPIDISKLDASITSGEENFRCFTVNDNKAKLTNISEEKTSLPIAKVVGSLPESIRAKVTTRLYVFFLLLPAECFGAT